MQTIPINTGLGHFVQFYADYSDYPNMVAGILWTGIVVLAIMELFEFVKRKVLFWTKAN